MTTILVSGAGIAGPALAYWLHRAGHTVTVVERAPAPRKGGQAVDLRGEGRTVITRMGLMDTVRARCVEQRGFATVNRRGRMTAQVPADAFGGEGIISEIEILRGDLAEILFDATRGDVEYVFDDTVAGLVQDPDGVDVTFERAAPRRFGLVVGADGAHSAVRALAFGPERDHLRPLGAYEAWFTAPADASLDGWMQMYRAPGGLVATLRPGRLAGETKAQLAFRSDPLPLDRRDLAAQRRLLAERFAGVGWKVPWLLDAMRTAPDLAFDSIDQVEMDSWSTGRVVLLGDAGWSPSPLTGLGTSLALVGAYVLAGELGAAGDDHAAAFARYESIMRPYVHEGQELPPMGIDGFAPRSRTMIALSALSMRMMTRWPVRNMAQKHFAKASAMHLPAYPAEATRLLDDPR